MRIAKTNCLPATIISGWQGQAEWDRIQGNDTSYGFLLSHSYYHFLSFFPSFSFLSVHLRWIEHFIFCIVSVQYMFWHWTANEPEAKRGEATGQHLQFHHQRHRLVSEPAFQELLNGQHTAHRAVCPRPASAFFLNPCFPHRIGPLSNLTWKVSPTSASLHALEDISTNPSVELYELLSPGNTALVVCSCYSVVWTLQRAGNCLSPLPCRPVAHDTVTGPLHMRTCTSDVSTTEVPLMSKANMGYCPSHNLITASHQYLAAQ